MVVESKVSATSYGVVSMDTETSSQHTRPWEHHTRLWEAVVQLLRALVGGQSILSVVFTVQENGPIVGALLVVVISFAACHAMQLYCDVCVNTGGATYDAVVAAVLGPKGRRIAAGLTCLKQFTTSVLQLFFASETLASAVGRRSLHPFMAALLAAAVWPSVFVRSVDKLKYVSGYSCVFVYVFVIGILACAVATPAEDFGWGSPSFTTVGKGVALMAGASTNSNWIAPISAALGSDNRSTMHRALRIAFLLQMLIICVFAFAGIAWHGKHVPPNFLLAIPRGISQRVVSSAFVTLTLVTMAANFFSFRLSLPQLLRMLSPKVPESLTPRGHCIAGTITILSAWLVVFLVFRSGANLGNIAILQGAVLSTALDFVLPMVQVIAFGVPRRHLVFAVAVIVFGTVNGWVRIVASGLPQMR